MVSQGISIVDDVLIPNLVEIIDNMLLRGALQSELKIHKNRKRVSK